MSRIVFPEIADNKIFISFGLYYQPLVIYIVGRADYIDD